MRECRFNIRQSLAGSFLFLFGAAAVCAEDSASNSVAKLSPVPPCAALIAAARANKIPLEEIDAPMQTNRLDPGNSVSALITLFDKGKQRSQWLLHLEVVEPTAEEQSQKAPPPIVLYSSSGAKLETVSAPAWVVVRTFGPFRERGGKPEKVQRARFALNKGFLSLGLNHAAAALHAMKRTRSDERLNVRHTPFSEAELAKGRALAGRLQVTEEQQRAVMGAIPALLSYFETIQKTPGLSDILFDILDLPSAWSLLRNRGVKEVGFHFQRDRVMETNGAPWALRDGRPVYHLPMVCELNKQPALNLMFVVTDPDPPLLACAGVVALLAEKPGKPENYLTLRVLSAKRRN